MINWTVFVLSIFVTTISLCFAIAMITADGRIDINNYGEGWIEVAVAGIFAVAGFRKVRA